MHVFKHKEIIVECMCLECVSFLCDTCAVLVFTTDSTCDELLSVVI
jgi:hypothetical protein